MEMSEHHDSGMRPLTESSPKLGLVRHQLDRCIYLSIRHAQDGDDSYRVFNQQGAAYVLDGIFGIHVDDIIGGGDKVWSKEDIMQAEVDEPSCFLDLLCFVS